MALYNITILQEAETIADVVTYANNSVDGALMGLFMLSIFFVMVMALKQYDFDSALLSSSFVCTILSMFLSYGGFLSLYFVIGFATIMAFTGLYMFIDKDG